MQPVTLQTPKPLVQVNGVRMIDTVIRGLHANGIREIYVVTGYLQEQFASLEQEYPGVILVYNPHYAVCNNISSLYAVKEHLEDVIILDGDQIIYEPSILAPEFERSGYNAVYTQEQTQEWLMQVENGIVTSCSRTGGSRGWRLYSISRWSAEDGRRLKKHLELEFDKKMNRSIYWDDVVMFRHFEEYTIGIRPMEEGDIVEIDSLEELVQVDASYRHYL